MRRLVLIALVSAGFAVAGAAPAQALRWHECSESKARISDLKVVNETCGIARVVMRAWLRTDICDEGQGVSSACWVTPRGRQWECIYIRKLKRARQINCVSAKPSLGAKKKPAMVNFKAKNA